MRFRLYATQSPPSVIAPTGTVLNGEVEDYQQSSAPTAVTLISFAAGRDGNTVSVKWETALEIDTVGFNLWRSASGGKYEQVNASLIPPASPGSVLGGVYEVFDTAIPSGEDYAYKLEEVETGGAVNWYGPVSITANEPTAVTVQILAARPALWLAVPAVLGAVAAVVSRRKRR